MLTRSVPALFGLLLACLLLGLCPSSVNGQTRAPTPSVTDLQLEVRRLRNRGDGLRREIKRQQQATGKAQRELVSLQQRLDQQETESGRLREKTETLTRWLLILAAVSAAGVVIGLLRRGAVAGAPAPLALARERTGRIHEGLAALEARIQVIEQQSPRG